MMVVLLVMFILSCEGNPTLDGCILPKGSIPPYDTHTISQPIDHFTLPPASPSPHYPQRYLTWSACWLGNTYPILFYTGNEGDITGFWNNTGFVFELAAQWNALVVFGEHRYYGESLPFGGASWGRTSVGFLSSEQALADYALLLVALQAELGCWDSRVLAFGGSYGGMLAAFLRLKYPHLVSGALAASAPVSSVGVGPSRPSYFTTVTEDYARADPQCPEIVREGFLTIQQLSAAGEAGRQVITEKMSLCDTLGAGDVEQLVLWVMGGLGGIAMVDYPYPTSFSGDLPGWPVDVSCEILKRSNEGVVDSLVNLAQAAGLAYNGTDGNLPCFDIYGEFQFCADPTGCGGGTDGLSWDYQACSEMFTVTSTDFKKDMFPPFEWQLSNLTEYCQKTWGIAPRPHWTSISYGGAHFSGSNVIFSNGRLDPWRGGGLYHNDSGANIWSILIDGGAHHLDLRGSDPRDPESVRQARGFEAAVLKSWAFSDKKPVGVTLSEPQFEWVPYWLRNKMQFN